MLQCTTLLNKLHSKSFHISTGWLGLWINDRRHFDWAADPCSRLEICKVGNRTTSILGLRTNGWTACLTHFKRWATGLFEILISQNNPLLLSIFKHLQFRQCLAYLTLYVWAVRGFVELCYELLVPYCLLTNQSFLPKVLSPYLSLHCLYNCKY